MVDILFAAVFLAVASALATDVVRGLMVDDRRRAEADWERRVSDPVGLLVRKYSIGLAFMLTVGAAWFVADFRWLWLAFASLGGGAFGFGLAAILSTRASGHPDPVPDTSAEHRAAMIDKIMRQQRHAPLASAALFVLWVWSWRGFLGALM